MTVLDSAQTSTQTWDGLRPMDPARDLGTVTDLIGDAFADELDARGRAALREMRRTARWWPFIWWWAQADPAFSEAFYGFVWEEPDLEGAQSKVVGNVSLNRAPGNRQQWIICNVAVREPYRGRGIGRSLTEAAIVEAQGLGASGVLLQVYKNNLLAYQLYRDLGFRETSAETNLQLDQVRTVAVLNAPGYAFRPWKAHDGQAAYELARLVTPQPQQWLRPLKAKAYEAYLWARIENWFADLFSAQRTFRLVALKQKRLVAILTVTASFRQGEHTLSLFVHPDHSGQVEPALVSRALHMLAAAPPKPVRATVITEHESILRTLTDYGFREQGTLLTLSRDF